MHRHIKRLALILVAVFLLSGIVTGILFAVQILPDIRDGYAAQKNALPYSESWSMEIGAGYHLNIDLSAACVVVATHEGATLEATFQGRRTSSSQDFLPHIAATGSADILSFREVFSEYDVLMTIGGPARGMLEGTLTILVPAVQLGNLTVSTFSGDVDISDVQAVNIDLDTSSGPIAARGLTAGDSLSVASFSGDHVLTELSSGGTAHFESSSGSISLDGLLARSASLSLFSGALTLARGTLERDIRIDTSSGASDLLGIRAESLHLDQFSGDASIADSSFEKSCKATTSSGAITMEGVTAALLEGTTFSGDVRLSGIVTDQLRCDTSSGAVSAGLKQGADVDVDTFSGTAEISLPGGVGLRYDITTFSGEISLTLAELSHEQSGDSLHGTLGDGRHHISVNTSSGDISLHTP